LAFTDPLNIIDHREIIWEEFLQTLFLRENGNHQPLIQPGMLHDQLLLGDTWCLLPFTLIP
jgi:hypothetical protein